MLCGILNINKCEGSTSRAVVNEVVRCCPRKTKVGHAGTLDPMATGVLIVAVGTATKLIPFAQHMSKSYTGNFCLGRYSDTEDATGQVVQLGDAPEISNCQIADAVKSFHGIITQTPPQYSAVKVNGERAYKAARDGRSVAIEPRKVTIHEIRLVNFEYPNFTIDVTCSKGTYIRTLGRDIAKKLQSDAVMTGLVRTRIGHFDIRNSRRIDEIDKTSIESSLLPAAQLVSHLPRLILTDDEFQRLVHGKLLDACRWDELLQSANELAAFTQQGQLAAVAQKKSANQFGTKVNFAPQLAQRLKSG